MDLRLVTQQDTLTGSMPRSSKFYYCDYTLEKDGSALVNSSADTTTVKEPKLSLPGFSALFLVTLTMGGSIFVISFSYSSPATSWPIQPTVWLSIFATIQSLALTFALAEAVRVVWWWHAEHGATFRTLHDDWLSGNNILFAIRSLRKGNLVAITTVLVAISFANGPLLQRSTEVAMEVFQFEKTFSVRMPEFLPAGSTGLKDESSAVVSGLSKNLTEVLHELPSGNPLLIQATGCLGSCDIIVPGAGLHYDCDEIKVPYNISSDVSNGTNNQTQATAVVFSISAISDELAGNDAPINVTMLFKSIPGCSGFATQRTCTFRQSLVGYPVTLSLSPYTGEKSYIALRDLQAGFGLAIPVVQDDVLILDHFDNASLPVGTSTLGGITRAINSILGAKSTLQGENGTWELSTTGASADNYVELVDKKFLNSSSSPFDCRVLTYDDPMRDIYNFVRNVMFRTAISTITNSTTENFIRGTDTIRGLYHMSRFEYMAASTALSVCAICAVTFLFWKYKDCSPKFSMSPVETAHVFDPSLQEVAKNSDWHPDTFLRRIETRKASWKIPSPASN